MTDKKILYINSPSQGIHYHRLEMPMWLMANKGYNITESQGVRMGVDFYDVIILNRLPHQPFSNFEKLKSQGVKIIVDIDDYWSLPFYHLNYGVYDKEYSDEIKKFLKLADVVWCSTLYLQEQIKKLGVESVLVPNGLNFDEPQYNRTNIDHPLSYGWVGGTQYHIAFRQLIKPLQNKFKALPVYGGAIVNEDGSLSRYSEFIGKVLGGGNAHKTKYYLASDVNNYGHMYNYLDIVLLPSFDDVFSKCKSNLKLLEAGSHNLPVITNGSVYKEVNGKIGLRANGDREWHRGLTKLIESKRMRDELGLALGEYVREKYDIKKINLIREQTI